MDFWTGHEKALSFKHDVGCNMVSLLVGCNMVSLLELRCPLLSLHGLFCMILFCVSGAAPELALRLDLPGSPAATIVECSTSETACRS